MAIVRNMWMRNTRQQVAGAVLYNLKGQTIQREKAAQVANPRTNAQMDQRVKLANLVNFYRANKAWMAKGAFETKKQTWSDYNAFVSTNLAGNKVYLNKEEASKGCAVVAPYIVTKGTLPSPVVVNSSTAVVIAVSASATPTNWGQMSTAIIATYPGLQNGDQLSIVNLAQGENEGSPFVSVNPIEVILDTTSDATIASKLPGWTASESGLQISPANLADGIVVCMSRTVAGAIKVSNSSVIMLNETTYNEYTSDSKLNEAIQSYGGSSANFLDSKTIGLSSSASNSQSGGSGAGDPGDVTP